MSDLEKVVDRLAARGPSAVRAAHCWFCAKIEPWFTCDCKDAQAARNGLRAKPRFDARFGAMILDEEIIERNLKWGIGRRMVPAKPVNTPDVNTSPPGGDVNTPVNTPDVNTPDRDERRRAAARESMRRKREADRAKQKGEAE